MRYIYGGLVASILFVAFGLLGNSELSTLEREQCLNVTPVSEWEVKCKM